MLESQEQTTVFPTLFSCAIITEAHGTVTVMLERGAKF